MKTKFLFIAGCIALMGCAHDDSDVARPDQAVEPQPRNTLKLANELFAVEECSIWGYLGKRDGNWYCRWCLSVDCEERRYSRSEDGEEYTDVIRPTMAGNTLPIDVPHWHDLDGVEIQSGPNVDFDYLGPNDQRPVYSLYVHEHAKCSNNVISISERNGVNFRVRWSGTAYSLGANYPDDETFDLDAIGKFTGISLVSEVEDEKDIDEGAIASIFSSVFTLSDFTRQAVEIDRFEEDGKTYISFKAKFAPK